MISRSLRYVCSNALYTSCAMSALVGALHAQQSGERFVKVVQAEEITDAVMISNISVAGNTVECGLFIRPPVVRQPVTPFQAGGDWLQQMTISLINRTIKPIVFGGIIFHFLDTGDCRSVPCVGASLLLGQRPAVDAYDGRTGQPFKPDRPERPPLDWKPGETIVVHVGDYTGEIAESLANYAPVTPVTRVNVYRGSFYFDDGMRWEGGRYSVPDPDHLGKFKYLPADYFPGKRGRNWPPGYNQ